MNDTPSDDIISIDTGTTTTAEGVSVTFSNDSNSFSIRCGKCADIHNAQLDGKTNKPCDCDCHNENHYTPYAPYCPPDPCCPQFPPYPVWYTGTIPQNYPPNQFYTVCDTRDPSAGGTWF